MTEYTSLYHPRRESLASTVGTNFSGLKIENGLGIPDWELNNLGSLRESIMVHIGNIQRQMVPLGISALTISARSFKDADNYSVPSKLNLNNGALIGSAVNTQARAITKSQLKLEQPYEDSCWRNASIVLNSDYIQRSVESRGLKNPENWVSPLNQLLKYEFTNLAGQVLKANWRSLNFGEKYMLAFAALSGIGTVVEPTLLPLPILSIVALGKIGVDKSAKLTQKYGTGPIKSPHGYYGHKPSSIDQGLYLVAQIKARYGNARSNYFSIRND